MTGFRVAHAGAEDWAHAVKAVTDQLQGHADGASLGFVYVTDALAGEMASILTYLRQKTGVQDWVGSVGIGVCADGHEYFDQPAVVAMLCDFPQDSYRVFPSITHGAEDLGADHRSWITESGSMFGLVHADPANPDVPELVAQLAGLGPAFLVGGLTSSRDACHQVAGRITGGGVSGVLFAGDVAVASGHSQGCAPVSEPHVVSDCVDNVVLGLDGERALNVFKQDVGPLLGDDLQAAAGRIHVALPIEGSDTADYMVRNLEGVDPVRGWLAVGDTVQPGDRLMFVQRDPASARDDLERMVATLAARLDRPPRGGVYVSCISRGPFMFGGPGREMAILRQALGDIPLVGFYAGGEISSARLYTYTGVLSLFL